MKNFVWGHGRGAVDSVALVTQLLLTLGAAAVLLAAIVVAIVRMPRFALLLILVCVLIPNSPVLHSNPHLETAGFHIYPLDLVVVTFGVVAAFRQLHRARWTAPAVAMTVISILTFSGVLTWVLQVGVQSGVNYWRDWLTALAVFWWAFTLPQRWSWRLLQPFVWVGVAAGALQLYGFWKNGFGSATVRIQLDDGTIVASRPIGATIALIMLVGFIVVMAEPRRWSALRVSIATFLGLSVLIAQHRSVWVAAIAVLVWGIWRYSRRPNSQPILLGASIAIAAPLTIVAVQILATSQQLSASATDTSTLTWRIDQWTGRLGIARSFGEWLFGASTGPNSVTSDPRFQVQAHNMYVNTISTIGIVGFIALIALILTLLRGAHRSVQDINVAMVACVLGLAAFGLFYAWPEWTFLLVGIGATLTLPSSNDESAPPEAAIAPQAAPAR